MSCDGGRDEGGEGEGLGPLAALSLERVMAHSVGRARASEVTRAIHASDVYLSTDHDFQLHFLEAAVRGGKAGVFSVGSAGRDNTHDAVAVSAEPMPLILGQKTVSRRTLCYAAHDAIVAATPAHTEICDSIQHQSMASSPIQYILDMTTVHKLGGRTDMARSFAWKKRASRALNSHAAQAGTDGARHCSGRCRSSFVQPLQRFP